MGGRACQLSMKGCFDPICVCREMMFILCVFFFLILESLESLEPGSKRSFCWGGVSMALNLQDLVGACGLDPVLFFCVCLVYFFVCVWFVLCVCLVCRRGDGHDRDRRVSSGTPGGSTSEESCSCEDPGSFPHLDAALQADSQHASDVSPRWSACLRQSAKLQFSFHSN